MISDKHVMAKVLRKNFTAAERALWKHLKAKTDGSRMDLFCETMQKK